MKQQIRHRSWHPCLDCGVPNARLGFWRLRSAGEPGREREEAERWGLSWTREDQVQEVVGLAFLRKYRDRRDDEARRLLDEKRREYEAEEYDLCLGYWAESVPEQMRHFDQAIARAPGYEEAYVNRGFAKGAQGDMAGAIADYDRAIELKQDYADAYCNRGAAKQAQGDLPGSIADYNRAIELKQNFAFAAIPSNDVQANSAWQLLSVLALNLMR